MSEIASKYPQIEISTKIPPVDREIWQSENKYWNFVKNCIAMSLQRLNLSRLRLLQFHQCDSEFLSSPQVHRVFANLVADGFCEQIGVSVYLPEQAEICLETRLVQIIQVPFNLVDRRFFSTRLLNSYASSSVSLIGRSIFLQGVLIPGARLPPVKKSKLLLELRRSLETALEGQGTYQSALIYAKFAYPNIVKVAILGVDSVESLKQNLQTWSETNSSGLSDLEMRLKRVSEFAEHYNLVNPSSWNE
jgi:aryl-alcohol dehydrogenase-like predicted oxidoreductase